MIFSDYKYCFDVVNESDFESILQVYNSNSEFLESHIGRTTVDEDWLKFEIDSMKEAGFISCKIVELKSDKIIGYIDYKSSKEAYLSILIIHNDLKGHGVGKNIYQLFEKYIVKDSDSLRIDVVTNYSDHVLEFWIRNEFEVTDEIELSWGDMTLPAVTMKKERNNVQNSII